MRRSLFTETLYSEKREIRGINARKAAGREGVLAEGVLMRATFSGVFKPERETKREQ